MKDLQPYLQEYLGINKVDAENLTFLHHTDFPARFRMQLQSFHDERLEDITVALVPDDLWIKGNQFSESHAEKYLIVMKKSYFEAKDFVDEIAWFVHELAHCQYFLNSDSEEKYQEDMRTYAFDDMKGDYPYPNNLVEKFAFTKQFQFLKKEGKTREEILRMLSVYYEEKDFSFFERLLKEVF